MAQKVPVAGERAMGRQVAVIQEAKRRLREPTVLTPRPQAPARKEALRQRQATLGAL